MKAFQQIEALFHFVVNDLYARLPQPKPGEAALQGCRIISHRGEHDNVAVFENTMAAFDRARDHGVWGIECDIRWTQDMVPVVFHDPDLLRLFGHSMTIGQTQFHQLRRHHPQVPTLSEVITRYGKNMHLMVEIKAEVYPDAAKQRRVLYQAFSGLTPEKDYHFLALDPQWFEYADFVSSSACVPVAQLNWRELSRLALQKNYGGIAGHYLLITEARMKIHHDRRQKVGTAYVGSKNSLFREINRGVDWIFSNHACRIQDILNHALQR